MERVEDSTHSPQRYNASTTLAAFSADDGAGPNSRNNLDPETLNKPLRDWTLSWDQPFSPCATHRMYATTTVNVAGPRDPKQTPKGSDIVMGLAIVTSLRPGTDHGNQVQDSTSLPRSSPASPTLANFTTDDNVCQQTSLAGTLVLDVCFDVLATQLQQHMARYADNNFTKLTADLTLANSSSIDAYKATLLQEMTDQIAKTLMDAKQEFHALTMDTLNTAHRAHPGAPPGHTSPLTPASSASPGRGMDPLMCCGRGINPPMRCGDNLPDLAGGDVCSDRQHTNIGWSCTHTNNTKARGAKVEADNGAAYEPPETPDTHTHHHLARPSPNSHPPLDYVSPCSCSPTVCNDDRQYTTTIVSNKVSSVIVPIVRACMKTTTTNTNDGYNDECINDNGLYNDICVNDDGNPLYDNDGFPLTYNNVLVDNDDATTNKDDETYVDDKDDTDNNNYDNNTLDMTTTTVTMTTTKTGMTATMTDTTTLDMTPTTTITVTTTTVTTTATTTTATATTKMATTLPDSTTLY